MKAIKKYFIRKRIYESGTLSLLKSYPKSFQQVGVFTKTEFEPDTNFITKLKIGFGDNLQIYIFVIEENIQKNNTYISISLNDFNLLGHYKNKKILEQLKNLDLLIDMTQTKSVLSNYAFNVATKAYKITLGEGCFRNYNLSINLKHPDQELFADEIIKYHNILGNG